MSESQVCRRCGEEKPLSAFRHEASRPRPRTTCTPCVTEMRKEREGPEGPMRRREYHLMRRFGITLEQYEALLAYQGNKCPICWKEPRKTGRAWPVDHCHEFGFVRGVICMDCNKHVLGSRNGEAGARILARAADYLRSSPGLRVLPGHKVSDTRPNGKPWATWTKGEK